MALTPRQRAANKAANRVRDQAFNRRYREYHAARDAFKATEEYRAAAARLEQANVALNEALDSRRKKAGQLQAQIEELKRQIAALNADPAIEELSAARLAAAHALNSLRAAQEKSVDARFVDITAAGPFLCTAACWKIPPEVKAEMDAARSAAEKLFKATEADR